MEVKKSPKADLESKRIVLLLLGCAVGLASMSVVLAWMHQPREDRPEAAVVDVLFEEQIVAVVKSPGQPSPPPVGETSESVQTNRVYDATEQEQPLELNLKEVEQKVEIKYHVPAEASEPLEERSVFEFVEQMPEFPGGQAALTQYLVKKIRYPSVAQENGLEGRVIVQFVVNRDGRIVEAKVISRVDPQLDKEALRVVNAMPRWSPGIQRGKSVRVKYSVPVIFRLQ